MVFSLRRLLPFFSFLFALFFVAPFIALYVLFGLGSQFDFSEVFWAFKNTFLQSFISATLSIFIGLLCALGLSKLSLGHQKKWRSLLELLILIPHFLPALFVLLAVLSLIDPFPYGMTGIVLIHTAMNWGLCAVVLSQLVLSKLGQFSEVALIEGCTKIRFFYRVLLPLLRKDIFLLWFYIFVLCFGSFAVPLAVGGPYGTTIEVLIYEKLRLSADWASALSISLLQTLFLVCFAFFIKETKAHSNRKNCNLSLLSSVPCLIFILGLLLPIYWSLFEGFVVGLKTFILHSEKINLVSSLWGSYFVGVASGLMTMFLIWLSLFLTPSKALEKFMSTYSPPSQVLTGFAILVLVDVPDFFIPLKIALALVLLQFPLIWRMGLQSRLDDLKKQYETSQVLSISIWNYVQRVAWPQVASSAGTFAGVAGFWAVGDFAISRLIAKNDLTLAMFIESLISSYRLHLANVAIFILLIVGVAVFLTLKGVAYVSRQKSIL